MSHSYKRLPIIGNTGTSDKQCKQFASRRVRHRIRCILSTAVNLDATTLPLNREITNSATFSKDGKHWMDIRSKPHLKKYMRK